tara:strand:- start:13 stop:831 length:819 start_codon:yes stop_codon:yes gene_type:complete
MKHNKKRNTAFIYETLAKELTKAIVEKNSSRKAVVVSLLKEYFSKGKVLAQELELYRVLLETKHIQSNVAERILTETKTAYGHLDENNIFDTQSRLIGAVNKGLGKEVWANFVPNFKALASVNAIFNSKINIKKKVLFEQALVDGMSTSPELMQQDTMQPIDALAYNSFIRKFNNKFGSLLNEQKELLNHFITSFADDGFELRLYLNEELSRLKMALSEISEDNHEILVVQKVTEVVDYLEGFRKRDFTEEDLNKVLKTQELVQELVRHDNN